MPYLKILDKNKNILEETEVSEGTKLLNAIKDAGVDILYSCGGNAKCTTCRVEFVKNNPQEYTEAEKMKVQNIIEKRGNEDPEMKKDTVRLSCQCRVAGDVTVKVLKRLRDTDRDSPGKPPEIEVTPESEWRSGLFSRS